MDVFAEGISWEQVAIAWVGWYTNNLKFVKALGATKTHYSTQSPNTPFNWFHI